MMTLCALEGSIFNAWRLAFSEEVVRYQNIAEAWDPLHLVATLGFAIAGFLLWFGTSIEDARAGVEVIEASGVLSRSLRSRGFWLDLLSLLDLVGLGASGPIQEGGTA